MVVTYFRERFHLRLFVPLACAIAAMAAAPVEWARYATDAGFALLLLAQFRLWDDLADRAHDAMAHPDRLLVRVEQVTPLVGLCGALAVLNICLAVWRDASGIAVATVSALDIGFGVLYLMPVRAAGATLLLLAKYPAILIAVAGARVIAAPLPTLSAAVLLYAGSCVYEVWHDPTGRVGRHFSLGGQ
jgi:hypothetical protein